MVLIDAFGCVYVTGKNERESESKNQKSKQEIS